MFKSEKLFWAPKKFLIQKRKQSQLLDYLTCVGKIFGRKKRGRGHKGLRNLLCCNFFQKSSNILIFWYCGRNLCFFKIPQFQDQIQTLSWLTPSAYSHIKLQLTHEIMDTKLSEKMKIFHIRELAFNLNFREEWFLPKKAPPTLLIPILL